MEKAKKMKRNIKNPYRDNTWYERLETLVRFHFKSKDSIIYTDIERSSFNSEAEKLEMARKVIRRL